RAGRAARYPLDRALRRPAAAGDPRERLAQDGEREENLGVLVMEDVHLAADLVDLVEVVPGPLELRFDERTAELDRRFGGASAQLVRTLLERPEPDGWTERLPARQERLLSCQSAEEERNPRHAQLSRDQLVRLDGE